MAISQTETKATPTARLNVDLLAIGIALTLAALIRLDILPQIKW